MPARCIHPAEPVYQVQPPRPTCGAPGIDIGGDDIGFHLVTVDVGARAGVIDRVEQREQVGGLVALTKRGERHNRPQRGMGVLSAVLPNAGRIALDVAGVSDVLSNGGANSSASLSCGRISSRSTAAIACSARADAAAPESTPQDWAMASIRHSSFAAEPSGVPSSKKPRRYQSPSQASRSSEACSDGACARHVAARAVSGAPRRAVRMPSAPRTGTSQATRFRPALVRRRGSCHRSSRRCRSAAGHGCQAPGCVECEGAMLEERGSPVGDGRMKETVVLVLLQRWPSRNGTVSSSTGRSPVARHSGRPRRPARRDRRRCGCARPGRNAAATSAERRLRRTAALRHAADARASGRAGWRPSPCRPEAGRETRRRRWPGRMPSGPRSGMRASGRAASR